VSDERRRKILALLVGALFVMAVATGSISYMIQFLAVNA